jgi:CubicO group peptidase (beta-lactamase class C family)
MPARDLARIGFCLLHEGKWREKQIVPAWFIRETAGPTHNVTTAELRFKRPAQQFSHGWELPGLVPQKGEESGKGIPPDARYKPGSGGQLIAFVPSLDLVITRQTGGSGTWNYAEYLKRACQAVLPVAKDK